MEEVRSILITKLVQNMDLAIAMLSVPKNNLLLVRQTPKNGETMQLAALNLIFGKQTNKQVFILDILAKYQDIINVKARNADLVIKDIRVFVIKMDVELILID